MKIPKSHPRYLSLTAREKIAKGVEDGITSLAGLAAHGRGEAFDYLLGEKTTKPAGESIEAAAAMMLLAKSLVISVNGNTAALIPEEIAELSKIINARLEVNIFHSSKKREIKIKGHLLKHNAKEVLLPKKSAKIRFISSNRRYVNPGGILKADVVFVPLEDGDRTEALVKNRKKVIVVELNPLSRSAQKATITICDNVIRAVPLLTKTIRQYKIYSKTRLQKVIKGYNNKKILKEALKNISRNLAK
ncbi:phosphopantothenate/pantothenate synthetase [Candidatus Woesearchaeota archaeon]|nr:phosphopantothenate/pantothenate synthetase [Candidatus Woesearchaeota archaeon]